MTIALNLIEIGKLCHPVLKVALRDGPQEVDQVFITPTHNGKISSQKNLEGIGNTKLKAPVISEIKNRNEIIDEVCGLISEFITKIENYKPIQLPFENESVVNDFSNRCQRLFIDLTVGINNGKTN